MLHAIDHMWSRRGGTGKPYSNGLGNVTCSTGPCPYNLRLDTTGSEANRSRSV